MKVILWDFDGVLLNSNAVRDLGFERVLEEYPKQQVEELLEFHRANGGLSRYVKFKYFFENILGKTLTNEKLIELCDRFSVIMKALLVNPELLIKETIGFVENSYLQYHMHIVSGSDGNELRYLCQQLKIDHYFKSIHGSPTPKKELVSKVILENTYSKTECVLIGDSINDYDAAVENDIHFLAYANNSLDQYNTTGNILKIEDH